MSNVNFVFLKSLRRRGCSIGRNISVCKGSRERRLRLVSSVSGRSRATNSGVDTMQAQTALSMPERDA